MPDLNLFIPITKVDAAQRLVFGIATAEIEDRAGEICDYASTKPLYEKWSQTMATSSGGKSLGNLRAMHGHVAAGKVTTLTFNDAARQIEICAKVVDDDEWRKVEEGVYTGFSQGGAYARRWTDADGRLRYTADPSEVSLVDLPCLSEARFEMVKGDGTHEWRPFKKSVDNVSRLAAIVGELEWLQNAATVEAAADGAESSMPEQLMTLLSQACVILRTMVADETAAIDPSPSPDTMGAAAKRAAATAVTKIGARNNAADRDRIQNVHDNAVALGATCSAEKAMASALSKRFDAVAATLDDLLDRIKRIEAQPLPLPLVGQPRLVDKRDDGGSMPPDMVEHLLTDPDNLSLLAIKMAQRKARSFTHR